MASKEEKKMYADILATLNQMKQPSAAQTYLDNQTMQAGNYLAAGDFRSRPNNAFFSIEDPAIENERRKVMMNSAGTGTSALAAGGADATAVALNKDYLNDKWQRDSAQNYQNQISDFANRTISGMGASANADLQRKSSLLSGQVGALQNAPKGSGFWGDLLRGGLQIGGQLAAAL